MEEILNTVGEAFGGFIDSAPVQLGLRAAFIYLVVIWLAAAYWAFRDIQLRLENPLVPYLAAAFIILFTPIFFPAAVFVYRIIRPQEKIGDVYERNLAEEALLAEVEAVRACPTCARRVDDEWIICPTCRTRLNRVCPNCAKLVGLDWSLCAWCGRDFERPAVGAAAITTGPVRDDVDVLPAETATRSASRASTRPAPRSATPRSMARPASGSSSHGTSAADPLPER